MKVLKALLTFVAFVGGMMTALVLMMWLLLLAQESFRASNGERFGWLFEKCENHCHHRCERHH